VVVVFDFLKGTGIGVEEADALFKTALESFMFVPYLCLDVPVLDCVNIVKTGENIPKFYKLVFNPNFHPIF
jgi:hypothetical protein